ncbi:MAG: hypothetical protein NT099_05735 [Candidatus Saganbacteria bacterium]|nr:hypothetical protein [Candidatus Saganbacteria bacterium]
MKKRFTCSSKPILVLTILIICILALPSLAAKPQVNFPYGSILIRYPAIDDPFPGLGNNYSCLANDMRTALWNPAGLTKLGTAEQELTLGINQGGSAFSAKGDLQDITQNYNNNSAEATLLILFTGDPTESTAVTREAVINGKAQSPTIPFSATEAMRVTDWLYLGFMTKGDFAASSVMGGSLPMVTKYNMDFSNANLGTGFQMVGGKLQYTNGGATYETSQPLWNKFVTQNSTASATSYTYLDNSTQVQNPLIMTAATRYGPISVGLNLVPVSATTTINNHYKTIISADTPDAVLYTPKIDTSDPTQIVKWLQDPDIYGTKKGYNSNTLDLPSGKAVAEAAFNGSYAGSALRTDLGTTIDLGNSVTFSAVLENMNSASLKMTGSGISSYAVSRINTNEASPTIDVTKDFTWSPFLDSPTPFSDFNYAPASELNYSLPRRIRTGLAFKWPFLIALDYEQQTNNFDFQSMDGSGNTVTTSFSNIRILRVGTEFQVLILPLYMSLGTSLLFKPSVSGANAASIEASLNSAYSQFPVLPGRIDLGLATKGWDTAWGLNLGVNALCLLDILQFDTVNADASETAYLATYLKQGDWKFTLAANVDEAATAATISTKSMNNSGNSNYNFNIADVKWRSSFAITYHF